MLALPAAMSGSAVMTGLSLRIEVQDTDTKIIRTYERWLTLRSAATVESYNKFKGFSFLMTSNNNTKYVPYLGVVLLLLYKKQHYYRFSKDTIFINN